MLVNKALLFSCFNLGIRAEQYYFSLKKGVVKPMRATYIRQVLPNYRKKRFTIAIQIKGAFRVRLRFKCDLCGTPYPVIAFLFIKEHSHVISFIQEYMINLI